METIYAVIGFIGFFFSALIAFFLIPWVRDRSLKAELVTVDAHKPGNPRIAEPGGIGPLLSFIFALLVALLVLSVLRTITIRICFSLTTIPAPGLRRRRPLLHQGGC